MRWQPIARVKLAAGGQFSYTTGRQRVRYDILAITLGPHRQLKCGCGRTWTLLPEQAELPNDADTCIHIKLLYGNGVVAGSTGPINASSTLSVRATVYLTPRGKELFLWRFSAQALK